MKVRIGSKPKSIGHAVELGFGRAEVLRKEVKKGELIWEGVERPELKRTRKQSVPNAMLKYWGFTTWLKTAKKNTYKRIVANYFFNIFLARTTHKERVKLMNGVLEKLVPGGELRIAVPVRKNELLDCSNDYFSILKEAGFVNFVGRESTSKEIDSIRARNIEQNPRIITLIITVNKPKEKQKVISL